MHTNWVLKMSNKKITDYFEVYKAKNSLSYKLPLFADTISAGFPSPADDYIDQKLDLNEFLIKRSAATFFVQVPE